MSSKVHNNTSEMQITQDFLHHSLERRWGIFSPNGILLQSKNPRGPTENAVYFLEDYSISTCQ